MMCPKYLDLVLNDAEGFPTVYTFGFQDINGNIAKLKMIRKICEKQNIHKFPTVAEQNNPNSYYGMVWDAEFRNNRWCVDWLGQAWLPMIPCID